VDFPVEIEIGGQRHAVRVHDISESGIRIGRLPAWEEGMPIVVTIGDLHPVNGKIVRVYDDTVGCCFEPQRLKTDEVRRLITTMAA
jgi:hypothetical protein